jgi:hypothetical protein
MDPVQIPLLLRISGRAGNRSRNNEVFFTQLRVCYFVAPFLTRGRVCNLLLLLVLASTVPLGSESRWTQDHNSLSQFLRFLQPGGSGPRIYIPQVQGIPDIPPGTEFPFRRLIRLAGLRWRNSLPPPDGKPGTCNLQCIFSTSVQMVSLKQ